MANLQLSQKDDGSIQAFDSAHYLQFLIVPEKTDFDVFDKNGVFLTTQESKIQCIHYVARKYRESLLRRRKILSDLI